MLLRRRPSSEPASSEITPRGVWMDRRRFLALPAALAFQGAGKGPFALTEEAPTPQRDATSYNNFLELAQGKEAPARRADRLTPTRPWTVAVGGECHKPAAFDLDGLLKTHRLEERVYRLRCVEGWSMVIPWVGFPLRDLLARVEPTGSAKFVEFTTLYDVKRMPGQMWPLFPWPYIEALRLDEAMNPLTLLAVGIYGEELPGQNGAPIRLVVPWKYGFKSIKSIVGIRLAEAQPKTSWNLLQPDEYGFFANVNPEVDHPRWSQRRERRIGEFFRRDTLPFNGYAEQVAGLYAGLDLRRNY